jgi:phosphohistidine phosphatase
LNKIYARRKQRKFVEVYLLRHGEAGKRSPLPERDHERGLTAMGKEEISKVGRSMADQKYVFDVLASSPLKRAKDTALLVNREMRRDEAVQEWVELAPEGDRPTLYSRLSKLKPDAAVLLVGHEPYLTLMVKDVISRGESSSDLRINLKKGGLVKLYVTSFTPHVTGELRWLLTPGQIRRLG